LPSRKLFRRSPHLVSFWDGRALVFHNYATGETSEASPLATRILHCFSDWRSEDHLFSELPEFSPISLRRAVTQLVHRTMLQRADGKPHEAEHLMEAWEAWNPQAGFFHFTTKNIAYAEDDSEEAHRFLAWRRKTRAVPAPFKRYPAKRTFRLPVPDTSGELACVLLSRRTWRRFGRRPVDLHRLGTLLGLTFGVQAWVDSPQGTIALKTSPSGGARHPVEAYLLARRVSGLGSGIYYYQPDEHALVRLRASASSRDLDRYLPVQPSYRTASAVVFMTAVFERKIWKYPYPAVYRSVLLEAGHLCQTFCLVATSLELAPFCTAALAESRIEKDLGIDGVTESVLYAAGVGDRPPRVDWAPHPDASKTLPRRRPPTYKRRGNQ
jgi:SagB-type dehydrogenase family enzyme